MVRRSGKPKIVVGDKPVERTIENEALAKKDAESRAEKIAKAEAKKTKAVKTKSNTGD